MAGERILVVDDNLLNLDLAQYVLETDGFIVDRALDVDEAWTRLRASRPDIVLVDIQLPGTDGLSLARAIKATPDLAKLPVIAFTAYAMGMLARRHGLKVLETYCDSDEHQFLISEKYQLDIPMILPPDFAGTRFYASPEQVASYRARSRELNRLGQGDQAVFFLAKDLGTA